MKAGRSWLRSGEVYLALALVVAGFFVEGARVVTLSDVALWSGCIVLGTGLLRDLYALGVTRPGHGEHEVAMCVESIVGVAAISAGLLVVCLPLGVPAVPSLSWPLSFTTIAVGLAGSLVFSAWVHDLVIVRGGRLSLMRHPDHGSFVVHLFRGRAKACMIGDATTGKPSDDNSPGVAR